MNNKTNLYAVVIAVILCLLATMLLNSCSTTTDGKILGKGRGGENYYLMLCATEECVESIPVQVTEEEYETYKTGEFYGGEK